MLTFELTRDQVLKACYIDPDGEASCSMIHMGPLFTLLKQQIAETHEDLHEAVDTYNVVSGIALVGAKRGLLHKEIEKAKKKARKKAYKGNFTPPPSASARPAGGRSRFNPVRPSVPAPVFDDYGNSEEYDQEMMEDGAYDEVVSGGWFDRVKKAINPAHVAKLVEKHKQEIAGAMNLVVPGSGSGLIGVIAMKDQVERAIKGDKKATRLLKTLKANAEKGDPDAAKAIQVASSIYQTLQLGA